LAAPGSIAATIEIAPGVKMPVLGLGTYKTPPGMAVESAVATALESGYRHIDTASLYGNEEGIGTAVAHSGIPRGDVFITTKVWNDEQGYRGTLDAIEQSLSRLQTDYIDLYLVHWPIPELMQDTWRAMESAVDSGDLRAIGVCNHQEHHLEALLEIARVPPVVDQIEFHFRLQQPGLIGFCEEHDIAVQAWAPLMRGAITEIDEVVSIAAAYEVTPFQVAIRWVLQRGMVALPKSVHAERIIANADVFGFELTSQEMATLDGLDRDERIGRHPDTFADPTTRPVITGP
jgi:diketogulonate reductase-like aldo/keto reductase